MKWKEISYLNNFQRFGLITKEKISEKPKGWRRVYEITPYGKDMMKAFLEYHKTCEEIGKKHNQFIIMKK